MPKAEARSFLSSWPLIGLPAFAAIFLPWQEKITAMSLVSEWFQPALNIGASIIGPLSCLVSYAYLVRKSRLTLERVMIGAFTVFLLFLLILYVRNMIVGIIFFPSEPILIVIWILEIAIYLSTFSALAVSMISGGLLLKG
jgi:hypothetical protein